MPTPTEITHNFDITKTYLLQSSLSEDDKRVGLNLLSMALEATNGVSMEDKIQRVTEIIFSLISWQMRHITTLSASLDDRIKKDLDEKCKNCIAYKHAVEVEKEREQQEILDEYMKTFGGNKESIDEKDNSTNGIIKMVLSKPYFYVFLSIAVFSPFATEIVKTVLSFLSN